MKRYIKIIIICILFCIFCSNILATQVGPIAQFQFTKASYEIGETVETVDTSYSMNNLKIVRREWMVVIGKEKKTRSNLKNLIKKLNVGEHEIFFRVRDSKGNWSAFTSRKLKLVKAVPITITSFKTSKPSYAKGEKLDFTYNLDNPNDLEIKAQRWRYKNLTTNKSTISGKPKYLKVAGKYEISLELQDERGNWSNKASCIIVINQEEKERNGAYLFNEGRPGDLIDGYVDKDYNTFVELDDVVIEDTPGTLIMSNSPESISSSGMLYKDTASGAGRILVHHANMTGVNKKLLILATTQAQEAKLTIQNEAIKAPNKHILQSGQAAVRTYFKGSNSKNYIIEKGKITCIYSSALDGPWENGECITGLLDFVASEQITFTVVAMDYSSPMENVSKLSVLPADGVHIRGTFNTINRAYNINISDLKEPAKLVLGRESEEWLEGKDVLTGEVVKNKGNYGLSISINIKADEDIGIILNARGGGYLGALKWNNTNVFNVPNEQILTSQKVAALVGQARKNLTTQVLYMLPNGSSAPVLFGFIPQSLWKE